MEPKPYYTYSRSKQMLLVNNFMEWKNDPNIHSDPREEGDALWRAGIAYAAYGYGSLKQGILRAFRLREDGKYQACRCNPRLGEKTVSRDPIITTMAAFKIRGDERELRRIARNLPYRLSVGEGIKPSFIQKVRGFFSKKYKVSLPKYEHGNKMSPNLWLWLRGISGSPIADYANQVIMLFDLMLMVTMNKFIRSQLGVVSYTQNALEYRLHNYGEHQIRTKILNTRWKRFLDKYEYPPYALHLAMWMVYTSRDCLVKKGLQRLILADADPTNLLAQLLCGRHVSDEDIERYDTMEEWRWSQRMTDLTRTRIIPPVHKDLWQLDKQVLIAIRDNFNKKSH